MLLLAWRRDDAAKTIVFRWTESGGPAVAPPGPKSFGTRLIEEALPRQLGGDGRLSFSPSGVVFENAGPLEKMTARAGDL